MFINRFLSFFTFYYFFCFRLSIVLLNDCITLYSFLTLILSFFAILINHFLFLFPFYPCIIYKNTAAFSHRCLYYFYYTILNLQIKSSSLSITHEFPMAVHLDHGKMSSSFRYSHPDVPALSQFLFHSILLLYHPHSQL